MIQEAYISGQLGKAIYADSGRYFLLDIDDQAEPVECRPMDVSAFLNFGADLKALPGSELNLASLRTELAAKRRAHHALTLIISGMDEELDNETRSSAIERAERLVEEDSARRFVRARMLARRLPKEAGVQRALDIAIRSNATSVGILYQTILDYEQAITLLHETWSEATSSYFSSHEKQLEAESKLTDLGAFAEMVAAVATGDLKALNSVVVTYGQIPELNRVLGRGTLVLNDLKTRLTQKVTSTSSKPKKRDQLKGEPDDVSGDKESVRDVLASFKNRRENPRSRRFTADEAKEKVDHQIEAISNLVLQGNINLADRYLGDLINFHVEHSEREHLGMSLCSLAKVAIDVHSFELAEKLVDYALLLGIDDVVISNTQAQMFKAMGDFDKALVIYEETMARFPNNIVVRNSYAEALKAMGDFDKALVVYEESMARFPNNEVVCDGYAEMLKAMGDFDKALVVYEDTMTRFPNNAVTRSGYAEVLKSIGDFDKALVLCEETMARFPNDEVACGGYAEVLKAMGDFDKALMVYEEGMARFPNNQVVRNGYAEVLKSMGDFDKALAVYDETIAHSRYDRVSTSGYASVLMLMNRFEEVRSLLSQAPPRSNDDWIDYHIIAMSYLKEGDTDEAIRRLTYGLNSVPWPAHKGYFANALAVAKIRKKEFAEVPALLSTNVANIDVLQRQTRLALVGHSQAALGRDNEAAQILNELDHAKDPRVIDLKEALARFYGLGKQSHRTLSISDARALETRIYEQEFFLAA